MSTSVRALFGYDKKAHEAEYGKTPLSVAWESLPIETYKIPIEDRIISALPGDDRSTHPLQSTFNPYVNQPPTVVLRLFKSGEFPPEDERLIREAIGVHRNEQTGYR